MKRPVRDLICQKGLKAFTMISPFTPIREALEILNLKKCSALLVVDKMLQGIFSEKDFSRASLDRDFSINDEVQKVMTTKVYYVEPSFSLEECLQVMTAAHVRHLPVLENGMPMALVSMRHIMEVLVEEKEEQIRHLMNYITGYNVSTRRDTSKVPLYFINNTAEAI